MANAVTFKKVKVDHSGSCGGFTYIAGQPVPLPDDVLKALGEGSFEVVADGKTEETSSDEDTKPSYKELQDKAKVLGLPTNKKYEELVALIAEKEAATEEAK